MNKTRDHILVLFIFYSSFILRQLYHTSPNYLDFYFDEKTNLMSHLTPIYILSPISTAPSAPPPHTHRNMT